ncbi:MAG: ribonuclease HI family protein [Planctomycetes bacterium]|nr:ribonuclease HI family protein [Planctomycetota bacterium]
MTIYTDGAARGNPGPAAFAYVLKQEGKPDVEAHGKLGDTTNNVAEYTALVRALEHARKLGARRVRVHSDSELMVRQMQGRYKVKNEGLLALFEQARELATDFEHVAFEHVRREANGRADRLCNEALDGDAAHRKKPAKSAKGKAPLRNDQVDDQAVQCLRTMAYAWSRGNPHEPKPEAVWEQLWSILEEAGVLRK